VLVTVVVVVVIVNYEFSVVQTQNDPKMACAKFNNRWWLLGSEESVS
jgi:hypothetical protein